MKKTPFDFKASLQIPNWHQDFVNVINEEEFDIFLKQQNKNIVQYIQSLENEKKRDTFLLSFLTIKDRVNGYIVALLSLQESDNKNIEIISTLGEVNFLKTGDKQYLQKKTKQALVEKPLKTYFLRRIIRTATWTKWWKLPLTIFKPEVLAIGHNEIVRQKAQENNKRVYFYQVGELLKKINKNNIDYQKPDYFDKLCEETYQVLIKNLEIQDKYLERFNYLVKTIIKDSLLRDSKTLNQCYQYPKLPKNIWIGSGTAYSFRLLALAVLRKGGNVTSFAHATGSVLASCYNTMYSGELAVTNNFIDITPKAKDFFYQHYLKQFPIPLNKPFEFSSLAQNNKYQKYQNSITKKNKRPTVVYTSNAMRNLSTGAPMINYMAYLKWQLNLTDILDKMDIDLICQPHPEGIFTDKNLIHPLRKKYNIPYRSFETMMQQADVFLVDFIQSTTFGAILITEKPIIRMAWYDDYHYGISKKLKPLMDKRCRNVEAIFDENNLPVIDEKELEKALTENWQEKVDATEFRELLIG